VSSPNIIDIQDAINQGNNIHREWQEKWLDQYLSPLKELLVALQAEEMVKSWALIPPELRDKLRELYPKEVAEAEKVMAKIVEGGIQNV